MLDAAGVEHEAVAANVDESAVKRAFDEPRSIGLELAAAKALSVSRSRPDDWVIGSDSVVSVDGRLFDKPKDREQAEQHLRFFSGRLMELTSAVALARDGALDWSHAETARLRVRTLSDEFIRSYLDAEWPEVAYCVGVFRMEGRGVQLFESVEGDHFAILGMPLIAMLGALRERGAIGA
jgi:septum formation protein